MKKQTAVEWYSDKLLEILGDKVNEFTQEQTLANHYAFQQAKSMEKEQIISSWISGNINKYPYSDLADKYYNETYGN
jgi:hypothetical protein